jgi:hypothetical protein
MLTPLGTGGRLGRRRRRWRRILVAVLVLALLGVVGYFGRQWWQGRGGDAPPSAAHSNTPTQVCRTPKPPRAPSPLPSPNAVDVEVLNGSNQPGLARTTADALANVGFSVIGFGNSSFSPPATAVVRYPKDHLGAAITVASYLPDAVLRVDDHPTGPTSVLVILGDNFTQVRSTGAAASAAPSVAVPTPSPICR